MVGEDGGEAERGELLDDGVVAVRVVLYIKLRGSEEVVAVDVERRIVDLQAVSTLDICCEEVSLVVCGVIGENAAGVEDEGAGDAIGGRSRTGGESRKCEQRLVATWVIDEYWALPTENFL